jgi:hypothetical protein
MKKLIIFAVIVIFGTVCVRAQGIKRVPKSNSKNDSAKSESVIKEDNKTPEVRDSSPKQDSFKPPRKDEFIDRDGDGINDQMTQSKPPEIKKQPPPPPPPPPKAPEIRPQPEPKKPAVESPKTEKKETDSKSSEKKSRR